MKQQIKHFYNTADFSQKEIWDLISLALKLKKGKLNQSLCGKTLAMLFFNPSLRTRVSFSLAMQKLGGQVIDLPVKEGGTYSFEFEEGAVMDKGTIEHVKEAARVLSRYVDAIAIRSSELITVKSESVAVSSWEKLKKDTVINSFIHYATVPVINMESNVYHPCQGLGDMVTIRSKIKDQRSKKYILTWVPHPKALPMATPNSQILSACDLGMEVVVTHPEGWELDPEIMGTAEKRAREAGGSLSFTNNQKEALEGANFICAKSWGAAKYYGQWGEEKKLKEKHKDWIVDDKKIKLTDDAYFMHCLPVRRNVEVTDEVLDSPNSLIYEEAENRMWAQMAMLIFLLKNKSKIQSSNVKNILDFEL